LRTTLADTRFKIMHEGTPNPVTTLGGMDDERMDFPDVATVVCFSANPSCNRVGRLESHPADVMRSE